MQSVRPWINQALPLCHCRLERERATNLVDRDRERTLVRQRTCRDNGCIDDEEAAQSGNGGVHSRVC